MLVTQTAWLTKRFVPQTALEARLRIELLRTVAGNFKSSAVANAVMAVILAAIDLQWVSFGAVAPWLFGILASLCLGVAVSRRVLARDYAAEDAGKLMLTMLLGLMPFLALWSTMVLFVWIGGNSTNNAFLITFVFASMAAGIPITGPSIYIALPSMAIDIPILATHTVTGPNLTNFLGPILQTVAGLAICQLAFTYHKMFRSVVTQRFEKEDLADRLCRTAEQLASARDVAVSANKAKSAFLANMSHELRTPLNAIIGFSDLMRERVLGPMSPAKYGGYVEDIHNSGRHLLGLINDLLDLAKIEAGKRELKSEEINIARASGEALSFLVPQAAAAGVRLVARIDPEARLVADERAVIQILTNLLSNAVKFTAAGGRATVFAQALGGGGLALGVEDNGVGMSDIGLRKALEPFSQASVMATVEGRGTGLGLPIVKALIEEHGAIFRIESTPGEGTRVWGEFPSTRTIQNQKVA